TVQSSYGSWIRSCPKPRWINCSHELKTTPPTTCASGWRTTMARYSGSTFWQLERAQTELRMRHSQAQFWRPLIGVVWLLGSVIYLWVGIGKGGRSSFWVWLNASVWGWLWPRHFVVYQGQWYEPQTLAAWLQQTVYGNTLSSWLLESLLMGMLPAL